MYILFTVGSVDIHQTQGHSSVGLVGQLIMPAWAENVCFVFDSCCSTARTVLGERVGGLMLIVGVFIL